jgi:hypothetical protein
MRMAGPSAGLRRKCRFGASANERFGDDPIGGSLRNVARVLADAVRQLLRQFLGNRELPDGGERAPFEPPYSHEIFSSDQYFTPAGFRG